MSIYKICLHGATEQHQSFLVKTKNKLTLTLKVQSKTVADDILFALYYFSEKINFRISYMLKSSAWQKIHMKCQALFSLTKKNKMSFAAVVISCDVGCE